MNFKYAHLADLHLGGWREQKMRDLSTKAFLKVIDDCLEAEVDFILFAGDLFNTALPAIDVLKVVTKKLKELQQHNVPLYVIAGSHDFSPSGKTMIDVLEHAGLLTNVCKGKVNPETKELHLDFTIDKKTGAKITGILGRRGLLDKTYYQNLYREGLEQEPGYKIFMFHTTLTELKPKHLEKIDSQPLSFLPKNFSYYAGGHIHHPTKIEEPGYGTLTYTGALFPNSFSEVEKYGKGGYYIITVDDGGEGANPKENGTNKGNHLRLNKEWVKEINYKNDITDERDSEVKDKEENKLGKEDNNEFGEGFNNKINDRYNKKLDDESNKEDNQEYDNKLNKESDKKSGNVSSKDIETEILGDRLEDELKNIAKKKLSYRYNDFSRELENREEEEEEEEEEEGKNKIQNNKFFQEIKWIPLEIIKHIPIIMDCSNKTPEMITIDILDQFSGKDLTDTIVTIRLKGQLTKGKVSDINFDKIFSQLYQQNAYFVMKNTAKLMTENFSEIKISEHNPEHIEELTIKEHLQQLATYDKDTELQLIKDIFQALNTEKNEGEKTSDFQKRIITDMHKLLDMKSDYENDELER